MICIGEDLENFKIRRRLASELREIFYSVVRYNETVTSMINLLES